MKKCPTCGRFIFDEQAHTCPASWECRVGADGESWIVYATEVSEAAEIFAKEYDAVESDYVYVEGDEDIVEVFVDGEWEKFYIEAYMEPTYVASPHVDDAL